MIIYWLVIAIIVTVVRKHFGEAPAAWTAIFFLVVSPTKWDPAIRIKEWQIRKGIHPEA